MGGSLTHQESATLHVTVRNYTLLETPLGGSPEASRVDDDLVALQAGCRARTG